FDRRLYGSVGAMPCCCVWTESGDESPARTADKALSLRVSTSGVLLRTSSTESANRDVADKKAQEGRGFVRWRGLPCSRRIRRDEAWLGALPFSTGSPAASYVHQSR